MSQKEQPENSQANQTPIPPPEPTLRNSGTASKGTQTDTVRTVQQSFDITTNQGLQLDERRNRGALWVAHYDCQIAVLQRLIAKIGPERSKELRLESAIETRKLLRERAKKEFGLFAYQAESKKIDQEDELARLKLMVETCRKNPREERLA